MQRDKKAGKAFRYLVAIAAYIVLTSAALSTVTPFVSPLEEHPLFGALEEQPVETTASVNVAALTPANIDENTITDAPSILEQPAITIDRSPEPQPAIEPPTTAPAQRRITLDVKHTIVGIASFYDFPQKTASGESYDRDAFTAAAQLKLRDRFGGIKFGRLYRPAYGLGEWEGKKIILRFNDVGPLRPGRTVDLSRAAMAYFAPLNKGLLHDFKVTPLPIGETYPEGPVTDLQLASLGIAFGAVTAAADDPETVGSVRAARQPHPFDDLMFNAKPLASMSYGVFAPAGAFWSESAAQVSAAIGRSWDDLILTGSVDE